MARAPVLAAGGIVVRDGPEPLIALVQRRKDKAWVLPKGKLKRTESAIAAARREVMEETGHSVFVHEFIGVMTYEVRRKPKLVQFWRMQAAAETGRKLTDEIKAVQWLPLEEAIEELSLPLEQVFLRNVGPRVLKRTQPTARAARTVDDSPRPQPAVPNVPLVPSAPAAAVTAPKIAAPKARRNLFQLIFGAFTARRPDAGNP